MTSAILERILHLLYDDVRLSAGGTAYATGWTGCTRERTAESRLTSGTPTSIDIPSHGYVNVFDRPYSKDASDARPGIYVGTPGLETSDDEEYRSVSSLHRVELRLLHIPLVVVAEDANYYTSQAMRDQLVYNIRMILLDHTVDTYWYRLGSPGRGGGDQSTRRWSSTSGQGAQGIVESICVLPVNIQYQMTVDTIHA